MNEFYMIFPFGGGWAIGYGASGGKMIRVLETNTRTEIVRLFDQFFSR